MDANTFYNEIRAIEETARQAAVELVNKAQAEEGLPWNTTEPLSFHNDPNWERAVDGFAELAGWIYDRVHGRNRLDKKSMTKKIRRALGYTYP